jgi:hypothetical protein
VLFPALAAVSAATPIGACGVWEAIRPALIFLDEEGSDFGISPSAGPDWSDGDDAICCAEAGSAAVAICGFAAGSFA